MSESRVNVYGYIRVSTDGQAKKGYSLAEQREEIEKYCSSKSYKLIGIFSDEGISGAKANEDEMSIERAGLVDMLASIRRNKVRYVVVLNTSRLWRSDFVKILIQRELKKNNVDVKVIDRPSYSIYTQTPNDVFVNGIFELLDIYERLEIALKLKRGRMQKAKGGGYAGGGVPFGYQCVRGQKKYIINPEEAEAVQRIFQIKMIMPTLSLQKLADYMNMEGYKGRDGRNFNPMQVKRILEKESFYRGKYQYAGVESIGDYEPVLKE